MDASKALEALWYQRCKDLWGDSFNVVWRFEEGVGHFDYVRHDLPRSPDTWIRGEDYDACREEFEREVLGGQTRAEVVELATERALAERLPEGALND